MAAVEEAARLLDADGAMVYLMDPATGRLRFAHDAGIKSPRSREWIRTIEPAPGVGMFGRAVSERSVVVTTNYGGDTSFRHAASADRVVDDLGIRRHVGWRGLLRLPGDRGAMGPARAGRGGHGR